MDLEEIKRTGIAAAYQGAEILMKYYGSDLQIRKKGDIDLVTQADTESEKRILESIRNRFPNHAILAEESGSAGGETAHRWIIDPLDGTTNFAHRLGMFAVSIAFALDGEPVFGTVLNPVSGELFCAVSGKGATLNGMPITVSKTASVSESLLVTGFPYDLNAHLAPLTKRFVSCLSAARGVRRLGSAAMDLCYLACGRFDGFWEQNLNPWDTAAGVVIAREAGARISDFGEQPFRLESDEILATNGKIHTEMRFLLQIEEPV